MAHSHLHPPTSRLVLVAARRALLALSIVLVAVAGCGGSGSKPANEPASGTAATPEPAAPTRTAAETSMAPAPATPAAAEADLGSQVFVKRCALCHGPAGRGDGLASKGLNPKPRNFHDAAYMQTRTDAQLLEVIHKGKGAMPKWEGQLSEAEITAVLAHVRALSK